MVRILVVEDEPRYREACQRYLEASGKGYDLIYAEDHDSALRHIPFQSRGDTVERVFAPELDAVVTDCFFPKGGEGEHIEALKSFFEMYVRVRGDSPEARAVKKVSLDTMPGLPLQMPWMSKSYKPLYEIVKAGRPSDQLPFGYRVARRALASETPVVMATSTFHHDGTTQLVVDWAGKEGVPLIDCSPGKPEEKETPEFWERVFNRVERVRKMGGV